jgi:hypothetical protein
MPKRVAIIGGGAAGRLHPPHPPHPRSKSNTESKGRPRSSLSAVGMACAWSLSRFQDKFSVDVWEALPNTGGVATTSAVGKGGGLRIGFVTSCSSPAAAPAPALAPCAHTDVSAPRRNGTQRPGPRWLSQLSQQPPVLQGGRGGGLLLWGKCSQGCCRMLRFHVLSSFGGSLRRSLGLSRTRWICALPLALGAARGPTTGALRLQRPLAFRRCSRLPFLIVPFRVHLPACSQRQRTGAASTARHRALWARA